MTIIVAQASSEAPCDALAPKPLSLHQVIVARQLLDDVLAIQEARRNLTGMGVAPIQKVTVADRINVRTTTNVVIYLLGTCLADRMSELRELGIRIDPDLLGLNPPPAGAPMPAAPPDGGGIS